jgi:hypothetical protein
MSTLEFIDNFIKFIEGMAMLFKPETFREISPEGVDGLIKKPSRLLEMAPIQTSTESARITARDASVWSADLCQAWRNDIRNMREASRFAVTHSRTLRRDCLC